MINEENRTIELNRGSVCDVLLAITHVKIDFMREIRDENTSEERKEIAERSLKKWEKLHEEIKKQLAEQDGE